MRLIVTIISLLLTNLIKSQDLVPPTAVCESSITVSLTYGNNYIRAEDIDRGSYDNIGIAKLEIRRMDDPCNIPSNLDFGPRIQLCCDDIATRFMVVLQVTDLSGNYSQCMSEVVVQDKSAPTITCLPDITVSCKYKGYSPSTFGVFTSDPSKRKKIILDGKFWGLDGLFSGGCGQLPIQESYTHVKGNCKSSYDMLIRRFSFPQFPGQECVQTITFVPETVFEIRDQTCFNEDPTDGVIWPCDYETSDCMPSGGLNPDVTGKPELIRGDQCGMVATSYHDQRFKIPGSACAKILREWIVFDWCNNNQWRYTQTILVIESNPPVIRECRDTTLLSNDPDCQFALFTDKIDVTDDCTPYDSLRFRYKLDIHADGDIDTIVYTDSISAVLPFGEHILYWDIDDGCSNVASCARNIRVQDGKSPTPVCRTGLITVVMPVFGMVTVPARSLDVGSFDNCTSEEDLQFSYSENISDSLLIINCDSLANNGSDTFDVRIYVTDQSGLSDYCTTRVIVQDNDQVCASTVTAQVKGQIIGPAGDPVEGGSISLVASAYDQLLQSIPAENGKFAFEYRMPEKLLQSGLALEASKIGNASEGLSVADIVIIQRHLLGLETITLPEVLLAADVDGSGGITAKDLLAIRRMILGLDNEFPNGTPAWQLINDEEIKLFGKINSRHTVNAPVEVPREYNWYAIKTGDVNRSWSLSQGSTLNARTEEDFIFYIEKDLSTQQSLVAFSVKAEEMSWLSGFQGTFEFDPQSLEFVSVVPGILKVNNDNLNLHKLEEGFLPFVWAGKQGVSIEAGQVLFTLFFKTKQRENPEDPFELDFGSGTVEAQGVNGDGNVIRVILSPKDNGGATTIEDTKAYPLYPNPSNATVTLPIDLSSDEDVSIIVYNLQGQILWQRSFRLLAGRRNLELILDELANNGVYLLRVQAGNYRQTERLVLVK